MDSSKITLEDRFTPLELATMFNVDCAPSIEWDEASRMRGIEERYVFNDIKVPLWTITKKTPSRGVKHAIHGEDNIKETVSNHPPGSTGRIADLMAHYSGVEATTEEGNHRSAFYA